MILKYIAATVALGTVLASTAAPAMPASNLAAVAPSMTDSVRYCRYRGCGRYYSYYSPSYYGAYAYGGPSIYLSFGGGRRHGGWGRW